MAISQIVQNSLSDTISLGAKIQSVQVANSTFVIKDDTAVNVGGGFIVVTGQGFQSNCQVLISDGTTSNLACSVSFVSSTTVRAQVPAKSAGTYSVYLINGDGGTAIRVNALQYSAEPTWVTASPLTSQLEDSNVSIQLSATDATSYVLQTGSSLPTGLTLSSNGLISGTVNTNVSVDTTFNFTVEAIDAENQDTPKAFSVTINVGDANFNQTILLLDGDGTNGANNNVFRDSSNLNFSVTRNGSVTQGSHNHYSDTGWSIYLDGSGDYLQAPSNTALNMNNTYVCLEAWVNFDELTTEELIAGRDSAYWIGYNFTGIGGASNKFVFSIYDGSNWTGASSSTTPVVGSWYHVVGVKDGTTMRIYINGTQENTTTFAGTPNGGGVFGIGSNQGNENMSGFISNVRLVSGSDSSVLPYSGNFTSPTTPLTAVTGTKLLAASSNRFVDKSSNNFTISKFGNVKPSNFTPFRRTAVYSSTDGGSVYVPGAGHLRVAANGNFNFASNNWTMEWWLWADSYPENFPRPGGFAYEGSPTDSAPGFFFGTQQNGSVLYYREKNAGDQTLSSFNAPTKEWWHLAAVRDGATVRIYKNGVQFTSFSSGATTHYNDNPYTLGNSSNATPSEPWNGYISGARVVNGTCLYPSGTTFTPPESPLTAVANTVLLFNGTNSGIVDYTTQNVIETVGDARVNTAISKFGTGSLYFDGTGDYLRLPARDFWNFSSKNWTIEMWLYPTNLSGTKIILENTTNGTNGLSIQTSGDDIVVYVTENVNFGGTLVVNTWQHIALVRSGSTVTYYLNGVSTGSATLNAGTGAAGLWIGERNGGGVAPFVGNIDDFRITRGFARYTGNFTPPSAFIKK